MSRRQRKLPRVTATDGELLMRYLQHGDSDAFAALVQRHGPLVWRVCRQVLGRYHDVQDTFQATFLILAQRAHSIQRASSLAGWLHQVAYRTAMRIRRRYAHNRETQAVEESIGPNSWSSLASAYRVDYCRVGYFLPRKM